MNVISRSPNLANAPDGIKKRLISPSTLLLYSSLYKDTGVEASHLLHPVYLAIYMLLYRGPRLQDRVLPTFFYRQGFLEHSSGRMHLG